MNQLNKKATKVPTTIQIAPMPVLYAIPTRPSVTQPLSADADEESAATQAPSPRPAKKKSESVFLDLFADSE